MRTSVKLLVVAVLGACLWVVTSEAKANFLRPCCEPPCPPPPPIKVVLEVCHPCTGCVHHVAVCLPACCQGPPCVSHQRTLVGCGRVVFTWDCGYSVVVRFNRRGGYRVVLR